MGRLGCSRVMSGDLRNRDPEEVKRFRPLTDEEERYYKIEEYCLKREDILKGPGKMPKGVYRW